MMEAESEKEQEEMDQITLDVKIKGIEAYEKYQTVIDIEDHKAKLKDALKFIDSEIDTLH